MKNLLILVSAFILMVSCSKNDTSEPLINSENPVLGIWVNTQYGDTAYSMTRSNSFINDYDGYEFKADGTFVQRANSGWCGTPPIAYDNYNGTWTAFPNNMFIIETEFWGGVTTFEIEIISITNSTLIYKLHYPETY